MRPTATQTYLNRGNTRGQSTKMTFHEDSLTFLMDVMINLYEDPELAPIREYASNAHDSHKAAGQTRPIEVTLPTQFKPTFVVRDFGTGMSVDDIHEVYSKYGYSTKRDSDDETGMLGLGSKSGLAYTDQFTVASVKDGVRILATVSRGEDGTGEIDTLDTSKTDEPNGVTISIPVHNVHSFRDKAFNFFRWWEPGTVLVDGDEPQGVAGDCLEVDKDIYLYKSGLREDYVVMGCVAYPVGNRLSQGLPYGFCVVAYVPMGAVSFPPSREGLRYNRLTNATVEDINKRREAGIRKAAESDIRDAKSHTDAIRAAITWKRLLSSPPQYRGKNVPNYIDAPVLPKDRQPSYGNGKVLDKFFLYDTGSYRNSVVTTPRIEVERFINSAVITGFTNQDVSTQNRRKIKEWARQNDVDARYFILYDGTIGGDWADDITTVTWDEIKAIRLPGSGAGRKTGLAGKVSIYDVANGRRTIDADDLPDGDVIVYSPAWEREQRVGQAILRIHNVAGLYPNSTFLSLATNRWDKFMRENDNVRRLTDVIKDHFKAFDSSLTDYEYSVLTGNSEAFTALATLDEARVDDPELKEVVKQVKSARDVSTEWRQIKQVWRVALESFPPDLTERTTTIGDTVDRYPFLRYAGRSDIDTEHIYQYINLMWKEAK